MTGLRDRCTSPRLLRAAAVAAATAAAALAAPPAHAAPGGDATVEETTVTVTGPNEGSAVATCPAGRRVVGGGIGTTSATVESTVRVSGPLDETGLTANTVDGDIARSWFAAVGNGTGTRTYKVFALCSASSDATVEETSLAVASNDRGSTVTTCPSGKRAVGGGLGTTAADTGSTIQQLSGPLDETGATANTSDGDIARSWYALLENFNTARTYKVFALCSANSDATVEETTVETGMGFSSASAAVACPGGRRVLGGGIGTTSTNPASTNEVSGPLDDTGLTANTADGDVARAWFASTENGGGEGRTYKTLALCATDDERGGASPGGGGPGPGGGPGGRGSPPRCAGRRATIVAVPGRRTRGTRRGDVIVGTARADRISAGGGNDVICAGSGNDRISGGSGNDRISGGNGSDRISGDSGNDRLSGGSGSDRLAGGKGRDRLAGGPGRDREKQ